MADVVPLHDPTNYKRVLERIRRLWNEGTTEFPLHAQERMEEWAIDVLDIRHVIKYGRLVEHSRPGALWRYRIEGRTVDGDRLAVVVEIDGHLIVVTVLVLRVHRRKGK